MHQNAILLAQRLGLSALKTQDSFNRVVFKRESCARQFASLEIVYWVQVGEVWPFHLLSHAGPRSPESDGSAVLEGGDYLVTAGQPQSFELGSRYLSFPSIISAMGYTVVWPGPHRCFLALGDLEELQGPWLSSWSPEAVQYVGKSSLVQIVIPLSH